MDIAVAIPLDFRFLLFTLCSLPLAYFMIAYGHLAVWHQRLCLGSTVIHENGRLTLFGSLFYFDHFIACVPMVLFFSLCTAGGYAFGGPAKTIDDSTGALFVATVLILCVLLLLMIAFFASIKTVGWQRTLDHAFLRFERDGVWSRGGTWHQLQLSNVPIALGAVGIASALDVVGDSPASERASDVVVAGIACIGIALAFSVAITASTWCGWRAFFNPRWLAHSLREIATYPLTGIPIALASVVLVEYFLSGATTYLLAVNSLSVLFIGTSIALALGQLYLLRRADIRALAQKPTFAPQGLSIPYLLSSHVFEHFLDFVLIAPLTGGIYAAIRYLSL